jgi:hypothetical protein
MERRSAELLAGTIALRGELDPFEPAIAAGISDATHGRLYGERRRPMHCPFSYALGFELGRYALHDYRGVRAPDTAEALAIVSDCRTKSERRES